MSKKGHRDKDTQEEAERRRARGLTAGLPVRNADLEPQRGIRYVAKLFKAIAILLLLVAVFQVFLGVSDPAAPSFGTILGEAVRLVAFAGLLWGGADLAVMLIKSHYDLRATRILMMRQNSILQKSRKNDQESLNANGAPANARTAAIAGETR